MNVANRPTRADRDRTVDQLRAGVSAGLLTVEEFEGRLDASYIVRSTEELQALVVGLPPPKKGKGRQATRKHKAIVSALAFTVALIGIAIAVSASVHPHVDGSPPSTPASPIGVQVAVVTAGQFSRHDPADQCGAFGTKTVGGGNNCYLVVKFTNNTSSAVTFIPADMSMVDQNRTTYAMAPVVPKCYDTIDVDAPATLRPNAHVIVQLCYAVMTGALPQALQGTHALDGLTATVPPDAIVGSWGGA